MAYDETQKDFPLLGSQVRIQDLVKGEGVQLLRPKVVGIAEQSCVRRELSVARV